MASLNDIFWPKKKNCLTDGTWGGGGGGGMGNGANVLKNPARYIIIVGTSSKRPPPVSDRDHALGLTISCHQIGAVTKVVSYPSKSYGYYSS